MGSGRRKGGAEECSSPCAKVSSAGDAGLEGGAGLGLEEIVQGDHEDDRARRTIVPTLNTDSVIVHTRSQDQCRDVHGSHGRKRKIRVETALAYTLAPRTNSSMIDCEILLPLTIKGLTIVVSHHSDCEFAMVLQMVGQLLDGHFETGWNIGGA